MFGGPRLAEAVPLADPLFAPRIVFDNGDFELLAVEGVDPGAACDDAKRVVSEADGCDFADLKFPGARWDA